MLQIRELVKVYPGGVAALRGLELDVPRGMFGLLGPNGSGKTTLMRILAGLLKPTSGEVRFGDVDVVARPESLWPRLGYLPQSFGFYPHLTGAAMLTHLLRLKGVEAPGGMAALCDGLLERVNLSEAAHRKVSGYSGGMRQRLGIAQALAGDPELVVVDEPTAGLDPEERSRFHRLLAEVAEERTVLLSTHIVEDVAVLCPRFAVIRHGRLLATTTPAEARAALDGTLFEADLPGGTPPKLPAGGRITRSYLVAGRQRVRLHLPEGDPPPGFEPTPPTLEDGYLLLVHGAAPPIPSLPATELSP